MINIVILNWQSENIVRQLLFSLEDQNGCFRIILVNNNIDDEIENTIDLSKFKNEITAINNNKNIGYAAGNNAALNYLNDKCLEGDVLILNPDVQVPNNLVTRLVADLKKYKAGAIMCRAEDENNVVLYDYFILDGLGQEWNISKQSIIETDYIAGSCFLIKRDVASNLKLFDEKFFLYWEEVDLSIRMSKMGVKMISSSDVSIIRNSNSTVRDVASIYYLTRNSLYLKKKHSDVISNRSLMSYLIRMCIKSSYLSLKLKSCTPVKNFIKGYISGCKTE